MSFWSEIGEIGQNFVDGFTDLGGSVGDFFDDPLGALEDAFNGILDIVTLGTWSYTKDAIRGYIAGLVPEQSFRDRERTIRSSTEPKTIIYGKVRTGGQIVYVEDQGKDNVLLWMCFVLAGHEVEEIETVYADGQAVSTGNGPGVDGFMNRPSDNPLGDNILCWSVHGKFTSAFIPSANVSYDDNSYSGSFSPPNWTSSHKLSKQAYVWINLIFDKETYGDTGVPRFTFDVKGKRDIYDPRGDFYGYTDNQALVMLDLLRWDRMFNEDDSDIEMQDFIYAANVADDLMSSGAGKFEKRYTANGTFKLQAVPLEILKSVATAGASTPFFDVASGKWKVTPGVFTSPVLDLDESDLIGGLPFQVGPAKNSRHNVAKGTYIDANQDYEAVGFKELYISKYVAEDLEVLENNYDFPWTNSGTMARRLAKIDIERNRFGISLKIVCKFKAIVLTPGDRIRLSVSRLGWSPKVFRVESVDISFSTGVALELREDAPAIYDWEEGDALALDSPPAISIPKGLRISTPSNITFNENLYELANGENSVVLSLTWFDQPSAIAYDIQYKLVTDTVWINAATYWQDNNIDITRIKGGPYHFRVRAINGIGKKSLWYTDTFTVSGFLSTQPNSLFLQAFADTPPSPQANFSTIRATVNLPADVAIDYALIEYQLDGDTSWVMAGPTNASDYRDIIVNTDGSTYNVRAKSVSISGLVNQSSVSAQITVLNKDSNIDVPTIAPLFPVTNLGVDGTSSFSGRDAVISWIDPNSGGVLVRSYQVIIMDTSLNVLRTTLVKAPSFTYTYEMNASDYEDLNFSIGTNRSFIVEVTVIGNLDSAFITHESSASAITISNPAPQLPSNLLIAAGYQLANISFDKPTDIDYTQTKIWMGTTTGFIANDSTLVAETFGGPVSIAPLDDDTPYYFLIATYDAYGKGPTSSEITARTADLGLGPWAYVTDADRLFIEENLGEEAIPSTKIESLTVAQLRTGILAATETISAGDPLTEPFTSTLGAKAFGTSGVSLISVEDNSTGLATFAAFESGRVQLNANANFFANGGFHIGGSADNFIDYDGLQLVIETANFSVDAAGNATFSGDLNAAGGTFTGTLDASAMTTGTLDVARLANIGSAQIANGAITNLKIGDTIQSDNFSDFFGIGWRIQKSGAAQFNDVVITRPNVVASGTWISPYEGTSASDEFHWANAQSDGFGADARTPKVLIAKVDSGYSETQDIRNINGASFVVKARALGSRVYKQSGTIPQSGKWFDVEVPSDAIISCPHYSTGSSGVPGGDIFIFLYASLRNIRSELNEYGVYIRIERIEWALSRIT